MALSWSLMVLVTALVTLLCSMCIYTEYEFKLKVPVKTSAENAFRFLSNPMVIKDLYPPIVSLRISSQHRILDPPGEYFDLAVVETVPVLGDLTLQSQIWYNTEARSIKDMTQVLWGLMTANVTWTVVSDVDADTGSCHLEAHAVTGLPWLLSSHIKASHEEIHQNVLQAAQQTIEKLSSNPDNQLGSTREHSDL